jgi:hypothetical protein
MAKQQRRKPPKRKPGRPKIDDDLAMLVSVLDSSAKAPWTENLFSIPWRDGWNAATLALDCYQRVREHASPAFGHTDEVERFIDILRRRDDSMLAYETIEMDRHQLWRLALLCAIDMDAKSLPFIIAGQRCIELKIANSHGGGTVYNDVWLRTFERLGETAERFQDDIRYARCVDVTGLEPTLRNDKNDRLRRAFTIAWDRGLYQMAYALPRAR